MNCGPSTIEITIQLLPTHNKPHPFTQFIGLGTSLLYKVHQSQPFKPWDGLGSRENQTSLLRPPLGAKFVNEARGWAGISTEFLLLLLFLTCWIPHIVLGNNRSALYNKAKWFCAFSSRKESSASCLVIVSTWSDAQHMSVNTKSFKLNWTCLKLIWEHWVWYRARIWCKMHRGSNFVQTKLV